MSQTLHLGQSQAKEQIKKPVVIYYASRNLSEAQLNYTITEKELLVVVFALEKFRQYLLNFKVEVYFDHATLRHLLSRKEVKSQLIRWILLLQEFLIETRGKGSDNVVADHLSRIFNDALETTKPIRSHSLMNNYFLCLKYLLIGLPLLSITERLNRFSQVGPNKIEIDSLPN